MSRTCTHGFRDRCPAVRRPGNGGGLRSRPSATESPHALAPRLPTLGINPPSKLVGPDGNAPSSIGYQPIALLLSYEPILAESGGLAPQPAEPIHLFSKQRPRLGGFTLQSGGRSAQRGDGEAPSLRGVSGAGARGAGGGTNKAVILPHKPRGSNRLPTDHRASRFYSPKNWRRREVMLPSGALPPSPLQTGAGASSGFASESPRGRICTCVDPLRRRRPELLGHAEMKRGSA